METPTDATELLTRVCRRDAGAAAGLMETVYDELRALADSYLRRDGAQPIVQPTMLVHEAWLRLVDQTRVDWQGRTHFKAVAAIAMRRALVDHARSERRAKRGGGWRRVRLDDALQGGTDGAATDVLAVHELLERLRQLDPRQARVVEMRLFGGLDSHEIAHVLDVSSRTVEREWKMGQAWLRRELDREGRHE